MGWVECIANTAYDWQFSGLLNNVHTAKDGDFSQAETITPTGALLVGTYDNFTDGDPSEFLRNLNAHMPTAACPPPITISSALKTALLPSIGT